MSAGVDERAFAKLNLILNVGRRRVDGLHAVGSVFASIELHDDVRVQAAEVDGVDCAGILVASMSTTTSTRHGAFARRVPLTADAGSTWWEDVAAPSAKSLGNTRSIAIGGEYARSGLGCAPLRRSL